MQVQVKRGGTIISVLLQPTNSAWNSWAVTKAVDPKLREAAFISSSLPARMTSKEGRIHMARFGLAVQIASSLDRAFDIRDAAKVLREETDILPVPYRDWPYQDPVVIARNRKTGRIEIKYQLDDGR